MCNEGTIRDWIRHGRFNVTQGKCWDSTGSIGPWMTTGVDLTKPLHITCKINGEVTQDDTSDHMIFGFVEILSYVSTFMTLKPGDIICHRHAGQAQPEGRRAEMAQGRRRVRDACAGDRHAEERGAGREGAGGLTAARAN